MRAALPFLLVAALLGAGCDDAFDPFEPGGEPFALYGFLDAGRDTQAVRVEPVLTAPDALPPPDAVRLTSTDLQTNATTAWTGTTVQLDGRQALLYTAPFRPVPGRAYRVTAAGPGGTTTATVAVPTEPPATVSDPQPFGEAVTQRVVLDGLVAAPEAARVVWLVDPAGAPPAEVAFAEEPSRVAEGQRFVFSLTRHADVVRRELGLPAEDSTSAALLGLRLRYRLVTEAVAGSGGLGAIGAVGAYEVAWTLPDTLVQAFGFRVPAREPRRGRTAGRDAK